MLKRLIYVLLCCGFAHLAYGNTVAVEGLRCEYREDPVGIDERLPRLSWRLVSPDRGQQQSAYRIGVASSKKLLDQNSFDLWDSQKTVSGQSLDIPYAGQPLTARQSCFWKVQVWSGDGRESAWSPMAIWEM